MSLAGGRLPVLTRATIASHRGQFAHFDARMYVFKANSVISIDNMHGYYLNRVRIIGQTCWTKNMHAQQLLL